MSSCLVPPASQQTYFAVPAREEALVAAHSISWRVFKNPIALFVGGVAAVILELAEPSVCAGVWGQSRFRADPGRRMRHTGLAALVTVYGARSVAVPMIASVVKAHRRIEGTTDCGVAYSASDPRLLAWVHSTAAYGFVEAYRHYVEPLSASEHDQFYHESAPISRLYGATFAPSCASSMAGYLQTALPRLKPSGALREFLQIMSSSALLPGMFRHLQPGLVRAAVDMLPEAVRVHLGLGEGHGLRTGERLLTRWAGRIANGLVLTENPAVQSCLRLGLPRDFLYD